MNTARCFCRCFLEDKWKIVEQIRNFHTANNVKLQRLPENYNNIDKAESSLWFTNLPSKKKRGISLSDKKRAKVKLGNIASGPLLIQCKHEKYNHYTGYTYGKFDAIPLASKGWHHKKSKGDHFTILPTTLHPAFLMPASEKVSLNFEELGVNSEIIKQLNKMNIHYPTSIQAKSIQTIAEGKNVLMAAETGCGKTLAYLIPMVMNILHWKTQIKEENNAPFGLILVPTRELGVQIGMVTQQLCSELGIKTLITLGGKTKQILLNPILDNVDILVTTLGVINKLCTHKLFSFKRCKQVVVDEADTLLDDSFNESLIHFFRKTGLKFAEPALSQLYPNTAQLCLVSATMPRDLENILRNVISFDLLHEISTIYLHKIQPHIPQEFFRVGKSDKPEHLLKLVKQNVKKGIPTMIFSNRTKTSNWVSIFLTQNGINSIRVNAQMRPEERMKQYQEFKAGAVDVISCTDVTSRGLDCTRVKHVINYEFPMYMANYVHRCGRTGRIGHVDGCLITNFISSKAEVPLVQEIEKAARTSSKLHRVNNNITKVIQDKILRKAEVG